MKIVIYIDQKQEISKKFVVHMAKEKKESCGYLDQKSAIGQGTDPKKGAVLQWPHPFLPKKGPKFFFDPLYIRLIFSNFGKNQSSRYRLYFF